METNLHKAGMTGLEGSGSSRALALALLILPLPSFAQPAAPVDVKGEVGETNYAVLPLSSVVFQSSWGSSPTLSPGNLFWQSGTFFTNSNIMVAARQWANKLTSTGIVAASGSQRWEDSYEVAQPAYLFPGEPSTLFAADRSAGVATGPEFDAWVAWTRARPNLPIMAADGGSMPTYFRPWGGSWGHISPLMPLVAADCPAGMQKCSYGDWYAYRWGQTAGLSGAYGIMLSDFSDSQPSQISTLQGFNPEIIAGFETAENLIVPNGAPSQQSTWIISREMSKWNDYLSEGYGKFYQALSQRLTQSTGVKSLIIDQCSLWPSLRRFYGTDERLFKSLIPPANYICMWDDQTIQRGRSGIDPAWGVGGYAAAAAREPDMRNGANLEANDSAYWEAIASFNPSLSAADQQEKGLKLLKRSWLEAAWAHIATRQGQVRRALATISRDYWDLGTLDPVLQKLVTTVYPAAPFGFAVYYSTAAERAVEQQVAQQDPYSQAYYNPDELLALKNSGVPVDYFVSDAALTSLVPASRPSAWLILEHPELLPSSEMKALQAVAPVMTSSKQAQSFAKAPISFSNGLTGIAFYDQNGRLIITISNPATVDMTGGIHLRGIQSGTYSILNLFTNQSYDVKVASGSFASSVTVARWDTQAYAITRKGP